MTKLGAYWSVMHRRPQDYEFFRQLQPSVLKIMDGGPNDYAWARQNLPHSLIIARDWALSEQHADMLRDPAGTGRRHAQEWHGHADRLGFDRANTLVLGINEPHVWEPGVPEALTAYTVAFCDECARLGLRAGAMQLSVGWPANTGPDTPPDWSPFAPVEAAIRRGNHVLVCHEYWADQGPGENWGWWAGRTLRCPWRVPIVIGECGIDMYVKDASVPQHNRGWRGRISPERYAQELAEYAVRMSADPRFAGCCVFAVDYANNEWQSFDIEPAYGAILATPVQPAIKPQTPQAYVPIVSKPPDGPPKVIGDPWSSDSELEQPKRAKFVWPAKGVITQRFGERVEYYLPAFGSHGHNGLDIAAPLGTPVRAVADGVVAWVDADPDYGEYIRLWHERLGFHTFYAHLEKTLVQQGQTVRAGQRIGDMGSTGNSTGPHLHFEVRLGTGLHAYGQAAWGHTRGRVDPETVLAVLGTG